MNSTDLGTFSNLYRSRYSPTDLHDYVYSVWSLSKTLTPFKDKILAKIGLEFISLGTKKINRKVMYTYYEYKILNSNDFKKFLDSVSEKY